MRAYQGNLCVPDDPNPAAFSGPEFFNFDIVAVGLGFHHFDDPALAARRLAERLKDGGVLTILDFLPPRQARCMLISASLFFFFCYVVGQWLPD
jgi:Methylase involved in ubiquinone/menaquinone biosynthesis